MRLLLLSDLNSIHTKKWVFALSQKGIELLVFGLSKVKDNYYDGLVGVKTFSADFKNQYRKSGVNKIKYLKSYRALKTACKEFQPDLIHAHYATSYGLLGSMLKFHPFAISVWGEDVFSFPKESSLKLKLLKRNLSKADAIFSTSKVMALETSLYTEKTIQVIPFGVDLNQFKKNDKLKDGDAHGLVIGIVKTLEDKYGINYLIDAFNILSKQYSQLKLELLIVGEGSREKQLKEQVERHGLSDIVLFAGKIAHSEVPYYFSKMDIVVIPSIYHGESFGVAAVEASACEKPVVVSNVGGLPEVILDSKTGLVCEPKNADDLAEKIDKLIKDENLRVEFGLNGRKNVLENYNWEDNVNLMVQCYKQMLNK